MGLQLPHSAPRVAKRLALGAMLGTSVLLLGACSEEDKVQIKRLAMPESATAQAPHVFNLWVWAWVAAMVTGVIVWALMLWVSVRYRRKSDDEVPVQTRYNLPLEIFYTLAPILMVIVFFYWTLTVQNKVLPDNPPKPDNEITVVGQQWSWTFNYTGEEVANGKNVYSVGTASDIPTLVMPVDRNIKINLESPDVIHSFWVPAFLFKMDVVPGRSNTFTVTPTREGTFAGKCAELCGTYHSRMLFNVKVVSVEEYEAYLKQQIKLGNVSEKPLLGGEKATTQEGLEKDGGNE